MSEVAFIGLGQMGSPMSTNILKKGHHVTVYDINPDAVAKLVALGAKSGKTPAEAAKGADFIITMLPNGKLVDDFPF